MTIDEAIKHCEEIATDQDKLSKRCDDASGYSRSHNKSIRTNDAKKHEKCGQDFRQLAEWLRELKTYKEQEPCEDAISREATIKYLNINMAWYDEDGEIADSEEKIKAITDLVNGVPPCTPKQKTGEILTDYAIFTDINGFERIVKKTTYCSLCKCDLGYNGDLLTHYCPNCGVKLEYKGR